MRPRLGFESREDGLEGAGFDARNVILREMGTVSDDMLLGWNLRAKWTRGGERKRRKGR